MKKSISYPIAKTFIGDWVHINDAKHGYSYYCPECESLFTARLGKIKTHHFAHKPNYSGVCTGESGYHSLAKHLLAYHYKQEGQIPLISICDTFGSLM
jgi:competence CoiA-like predicted nuclease